MDTTRIKRLSFHKANLPRYQPIADSTHELQLVSFIVAHNELAGGFGLNQQIVDASSHKKILAWLPLYRYRTLEEAAAVVWFLLNPAVTNITCHQDTAVDGGAPTFGF